jgi:hypothetical protein
MGNAGANIVVDAGCCPAVIFLTLRKIFGRLRVVYGRSSEHSRWFGRLPHSRPQQLKFNRPVASVKTAWLRCRSSSFRFPHDERR